MEELFEGVVAFFVVVVVSVGVVVAETTFTVVVVSRPILTDVIEVVVVASWELLVDVIRFVLLCVGVDVNEAKGFHVDRGMVLRSFVEDGTAVSRNKLFAVEYVLRSTVLLVCDVTRDIVVIVSETD